MTFWTEERVEALKHQWSAGKSAGVIAETLGCVSRNAVIGKLHRMGIGRMGQARLSQVRRARGRGRRELPAQQPRLPRPDGLEALKAVEISDKTERARVSSIHQLEPNHCRYMIGSGFCGCETLPDKSWCETHYRRVFERFPSSDEIESRLGGVS